jgi:hypothetical protein
VDPPRLPSLWNELLAYVSTCSVPSMVKYFSVLVSVHCTVCVSIYKRGWSVVANWDSTQAFSQERTLDFWCSLLSLHRCVLEGESKRRLVGSSGWSDLIWSDLIWSDLEASNSQQILDCWSIRTCHIRLRSTAPLRIRKSAKRLAFGVADI